MDAALLTKDTAVKLYPQRVAMAAGGTQPGNTALYIGNASFALPAKRDVVIQRGAAVGWTTTEGSNLIDKLIIICARPAADTYNILAAARDILPLAQFESRGSFSEVQDGYVDTLRLYLPREVSKRIRKPKQRDFKMDVWKLGRSVKSEFSFALLIHVR